jgi:hypothetical protein
MTNVTIRGIDDGAWATVTHRAEAKHQSINAYVVELIEREAGLPTLDEWFAELEELPEHLDITSEQVVAAIAQGRS